MYQLQRRDSTLWQNSGTNSNPYLVLGTLYYLPHISNLRKPSLTPSLPSPLRCLSRLDLVLTRVLLHTLSAFQRHHGR